MTVTNGLSGSKLQPAVLRALIVGCLIVLLISCVNSPAIRPTANCPRWLPPQSAMTECEVPEFVGTTWGDGGRYALALKRELWICKKRLDEVIEWRNKAIKVD
ncbi:Rz1-like lysis system protein LysC [Yersinia enterocolitica]|uniref:Rz1-like lysis system protein LysC n=1 Tax=Yersinia enterocolitica TaxID=630 RepID=UPI003F5412DD